MTKEKYRQNDISAWKNYGEKMGFFDYFKDEIFKAGQKDMLEKIQLKLNKGGNIDIFDVLDIVCNIKKQII